MRRMRLFIESADSGYRGGRRGGSIMGRLLGWSRRRRAAETRRYLELVAAEQIDDPAGGASAAVRAGRAGRAPGVPGAGLAAAG